jgi:hypothetical protein
MMAAHGHPGAWHDEEEHAAWLNHEAWHHAHAMGGPEHDGMRGHGRFARFAHPIPPPEHRLDEVERTLDHILRELDEIRHELSR